MLLLLLFLSYAALANSADCINTDGIEKKLSGSCWCGENEHAYCLADDDYCKVDAETNRGECFSCYRGKKVVILPAENGLAYRAQVCRDCAQSVRYFFLQNNIYTIYIELTFFSYNCFP